MPGHPLSPSPLYILYVSLPALRAPAGIIDLADVALLGRAASEDLGSMEMKPMGKAAFMSWWVLAVVIRYAYEGDAGGKTY